MYFHIYIHRDNKQAETLRLYCPQTAGAQLYTNSKNKAETEENGVTVKLNCVANTISTLLSIMIWRVCWLFLNKIVVLLISFKGVICV